MIDNWRDLTLATYDEIERITDTEKDLTRRTSLILAELADMPVEDIEDLPVGIYMDMKDRAEFLLEAPKVAPRYRGEYRVGDFTLVPTTRLDKLTAAQYIDFQTICSKTETDLAALLAVILVPKGKTYGKGYDIADVKTAIRDNLGMSYILELRAFFFSLCGTLMRYFQTCLVRAMKTPTIPKEKRKELTEKLTDNIRTAETSLKALTASGGGWPSLTRLAN